MTTSLLEIGRLRRRNAFNDPIHRKKSSRIRADESALFQQPPTFSRIRFALLAARAGIDPRVASGSSGEALTDETRENYRRRYQELQEDLLEAKENNDLGQIEKLQGEAETLTNELASATGLGGRSRQKSDIEKVRKSVSMAVTRAIESIGKEHESLGRHLTTTISSGLVFRYAPEREIVWLN